ncbi:MAG: single-stranded-DNA-specific exonuclease RecJ [Synechococcales cyanobacterium M58_A2018_015]|nr:single-stranded-DNA-specific exonuclease RecJ [Synechococcales cyanobacterium M58_A2018_015]
MSNLRNSSHGSEWSVRPVYDLPAEFLAAVQSYLPDSTGTYAAQLLWQRGLRDVQQLAGFVDANAYTPTSPFEFGLEMQRAVERLLHAHQRQERVAIWGDFDVDGITATAVLWDGLSEFFPPPQLTYVIPNRLTESHGLSLAGIDRLAKQGYSLIVTCDTGSTQFAELAYAQQHGIEVIVTDHHVLAEERPPVVALLNPRAFSADHPLAHLAGVAVAYKLMEALYETLPQVPRRPVKELLDLVAIGLIADLAQLTGDCRYLAQRGIAYLQSYAEQDIPPRPGIAHLLHFCRRSGDRPTDISFGLGPRINAVSRIQGDAHFCVELLTSRDPERSRQLAEATELANTRRRSLQRQVLQQVKSKLQHVDLSTTGVIVLSDPQWSVGILGLVAGQIAQEYGRPTILLSSEGAADQGGQSAGLARGSARSVEGIDLYQLIQQQAHLLHRFGGHPLAAGLSLPVENIPLLSEALNQQILSQNAIGGRVGSLSADLTVPVAALGRSLFRELKLLEPCGIGNPVPKLLIQNCWFRRVWHKKISDYRGQPVEYIKTEFELCDDSWDLGFPGTWWGHYKDELPSGRCDAIVELDFNSYEDAKCQKRYEVRLIAVRPAVGVVATAPPARDWIRDWILDGRGRLAANLPSDAGILQVTTCPRCWEELQAWCRRAAQTGQRLALAYGDPVQRSAAACWQQLVGIAKYLSRTQTVATRQQLLENLQISDVALQLGLESLSLLGFRCSWLEQPSEQGTTLALQVIGQFAPVTDSALRSAMTQFIEVVQEEQFRQRYFYEVPLATIQDWAARLPLNSQSTAE